MSVKKQTFHGILWNLIDVVFLKVVNFSVNIYLARILSPQDYGLIAIVSIFILLGSSFVESGLGRSIIRSKEIDNADLDTVFYTNLGLSFFIFLLTYLLAPFIASYYDNENLNGLIRVYSFVFIVTGFSIVQKSFLERNLLFKKITLLKVPAVIISSVAAVVAAMYGLGVWSLVILFVGNQLFETIGLWYFSTWKPGMRFSREKFKKHFGFGIKLFLSQLIDVSVRELNSLIIGKQFSIHTLGLYGQARKINLLPISIFDNVVSKTSYPVMARIKEDRETLSRSYKVMLNQAFLGISFIALAIHALAEPLILFLLTDKWSASIGMLKILVFAGILMPIHSLNLNILILMGKSQLFLKLEIIKNAIMLLGIIIGLQFGLYGLIVCKAVVSFIAFFINAFYSKEMIGYSIFDQVRDMIPTFMTGLLSSFITQWFLMYSDLDSLIMQLCFGGLVYATSFVLIGYLINRKKMLYVLTLKDVLKGKT